MYRPTISIRAMLCVVAFVGLACVALVRANSIWATVMFTGALAVISLGLLAAILLRGARQAYWAGFALFGWLYLWMAHWPSDTGWIGPNQPASWRLQQNETGPLATTRLLAHAYLNWLPMVRTPQVVSTAATPIETSSDGSTFVISSGSLGVGGFVDPSAGGYGGVSGGTLTITPAALPPTVPVPVAISYPLMHEFMRIGHSLFTIIVAGVGGALATYLYQTRDRAAA
jgi:hypothetical protein